MKAISTAIIAILVGSAGVASADKPRVAGDQHEPPLYTDVGSVHFDAITRDGGYGTRNFLPVFGTKSDADGIRLEFKQGGKVLGTAKCVPNSALTTGETVVSCEDPKVTLKAVGTVEANLIYVEDATDKQYLVQTFKLQVVTWTAQHKTKTYQILPDDTMGVAYADNVAGEDLSVMFTTTSDPRGDMTLRCKIGGTQIDDFVISSGGGSGGIGGVEVDVLKDSGPRLTYHYQGHQYGIEHLTMGTKAGYKGNHDKSKMRFAGDNPGDWACDMRVDGKVFRQFMFTVGADGMIAKSGLETAAKNPVKVAPGRVVIGMVIPKGIETHFRPALVKATYGYGQPWPDAPEVKKWLAALPPAAGPDVK